MFVLSQTRYTEIEFGDSKDRANTVCISVTLGVRLPTISWDDEPRNPCM